MSETPLLIATHNRNKLREFQAIFHDLPFRLITLEDVGISHDIEETGTTFSANAQLKALGYAALSGLLSLADDSGLEIDALNGAPGVYSARYAPSPAEYRARVLRELADVPEQRRTARFRCVICIAIPDSDSTSGARSASILGEVDGTLEGRIAYAEAGEHGFGYDPLFYLPDYGCTLAQLKPDEKNKISHRARAAEAARTILAQAPGANNTLHPA